MTSNSSLTNLFKNDRELFLETLGSFTLLDIGMIESINAEGRAVVLTNRYIANERIVYQDVEVVYPGNTRSAYVADCSGSACLILMPYTCMPNTTDRKIRPGATPYNKDGIKVIPIGNGSKSTVRHLINTAGEFSLGTAVYNISFDKETISLSQGSVLTLSKDAEGNIFMRHKTEKTGAMFFGIDNDGIHKSYSSLDGSVSWKDSIDTEGVRTFTQTDKDGNTLSSVVVDAEGTVTITSAKSIILNTEENVQMNGDSKHLVKYEDLEAAMNKLYTALTTTPITGNGAPQSTWTGITSIDISASKADTLLTGDD